MLTAIILDLLVNGFGIFTNAAGAKIAWWIDPMGAMIISLVLIGSWSWTAASTSHPAFFDD